MVRHRPTASLGAGSRRVALLNPNTDRVATAAMVAAARAGLPADVGIEGRTPSAGAAMITTERALAEAVPVVVETGISLADEGYDGIIISAFGDPGLDGLRARLAIPVVGIAEAGMAAAAAGDRRFGVVTVTPDLVASIRGSAVKYGFGGQLAAVLTTPGDPRSVLADGRCLEQALLELCRHAVADHGCEAIVIGGGPLAPAAIAIAPLLTVPVIEPVGAAAARMGGVLGALSQHA